MVPWWHKWVCSVLVVCLKGRYRHDQHLTFPSFLLCVLANVKKAYWTFCRGRDLACDSRLPGPADHAAWPSAGGPQPSLPVAGLNSIGVPSKEKSGASWHQRYVAQSKILCDFSRFPEVDSIFEMPHELVLGFSQTVKEDWNWKESINTFWKA